MSFHYHCVPVPRASKVVFAGECERHSVALSLIKKAGDFALVVRGVRRALVMRCPDGCGEVVTINLDPRSGPAWRTYGRETRLSLYPSVWREDGCKAHFIIWRSDILWCSGRRYERPSMNEEFLSEILGRLRRDAFRSYRDVAEELDENPWEVLWACSALVERGDASEEKDWTFALPGAKP